MDTKYIQSKVLNKGLNRSKKRKDDQLSEGNQKDHFRKGQAEVIAYYPLQGGASDFICRRNHDTGYQGKSGRQGKSGFLLYGETRFDF